MYGTKVSIVTSYFSYGNYVFPQQNMGNVELVIMQNCYLKASLSHLYIYIYIYSTSFTAAVNVEI